MRRSLHVLTLNALIVTGLFLAASPAGAQDKKGPRATVKCLTDLKIQDLTLGYTKAYKVTEGLSTKDYDGFVGRTPGKIVDGCVIDLQPEQCAVMYVDKEKYETFGNSNDWQVQCVQTENPGAGMLPQGVAPYTVDNVQNKHMMLKCGHDQGEGVECHEGNNSARGGEWQKRLDGKKQEMISFCAWKAHPVEAKDALNKKVYCQYFNKKSGKVLFATEYLLAPR
jgi:hypothetical protein